MNRNQLIEARRVMFDFAETAETATELAEDTATVLGLEYELDDTDSPIWRIAYEVFTEIHSS